MVLARFLSVARRTSAVSLLVLVVLLLASMSPPLAIARGGEDDDEARVAGTCGRGASSELRLRAEDDGIRVKFEVDHHRRGGAWRVVLVQDRRVVWRGQVRTRGSGDSFEIERRLRNLPGADRVTARASGPRGLTCVAAATLRG